MNSITLKPDEKELDALNEFILIYSQMKTYKLP